MVTKTAEPEAATAEDEGGVAPGPGQEPAPEPASAQLTVDELQAQVDAKTQEIDALKAERAKHGQVVSGKDRRINQLETERRAIAEELREELRQGFLALGEVMLSEEGDAETLPPSRLQRLHQRFAPKPKAQPAPVSQEEVSVTTKAGWEREVARCEGKRDAIFESVGLDPEVLPPEVLSELTGAIAFWKKGQLEDHLNEVRRVAADYQKAQALAEREAAKRKADKLLSAKGASQGPTGNPTLEALLAQPVHKMTLPEMETYRKNLDAAVKRGG